MKKIYLTLSVLTISMSQLLAQFSGGDGSIGDPYQITTKMDLKTLSDDPTYWGDHFIQMDDILFNASDFDVTGDFYYGGDGFLPIGEISGTPFTGVYNGNGHTISNLYILRNNSRLGLFGYTSNATISDIGLIDANVSGDVDYLGILIGDCYATTISNCYATGNATSYAYAGGLIGYAYECVLTNCYSSATVSADDEYAGGLVGYTEDSELTNCYATGNVSAYREAGGLVGYTEDTEITDCYATGNVEGSRYLGGLIGYMYEGQLSGSYATGAVEGNDEYIGGLLGRAEQDINITNCYATGNVKGNEDVGGLIGRTNDNVTLLDCFATGDVQGENAIGGLIGSSNNLSITNSYAEGTILGEYQAGGLIGYSYYTNVSMCHATGSVTATSAQIGGLIGYTYESTISNSFATGNIISDNNFIGGLIGYANDSDVSLCYATGDVASDNYFIGGLLGYSDYNSIIESYATGNVIGYQYAGGLIGYADFLNTVENNYATGNVNGESLVGGLIGYVYSANAISLCYATGDVEVVEYSAGGLIGEAYYVAIAECYATGNVVGENYVGGLVAYAYDVTINNSYTTGTVTGNDDYVGGLIGYVDDSEITNSYSVGRVTGPGDIGGLIGYNDGSDVYDSFYDEETSGQNDNDGRGEPRSTADMKTEATFTNEGWDFVAIWKMDLGCPNDGYPIFVSQSTQVKTVEPTPASSTQDICENSEIADLDITGDNIKWYDQAIGGNLLTESTVLTDATSYYATQTVDGCESNRIEVTVNNITPILDPVSNLSECDSYTLPVLTVGDYFTDANAGGTQLNDGDVITDSQTIYIYAENAGCTAESSFDLTIIELPLNTVTTATNGTLSADEIVAAYQWIDCDNMNSPISGAVNQFFIPTSSGNYAVEVTKNGCSITSDCTPITISNVGFDENNLNQIAVYPNPSNGEFTVNLGEINDATIVIRDLAGKEVYRSHTTSSIVEVQLLEATGIYFLEVQSASQSKTVKIVKH